MPRRLWIAAGVLALALAVPAHALGHDLIMAGKGIGLFRLGMTGSQVRVLARSAPCAVSVLYQNGRATRLETNCGGAFATPERIMVGHSPRRVLLLYGSPDRVWADNYFGTRADWLDYRSVGIAFRVIHGYFGSGLIQAIAVFKGSGIRTPVPYVEPPPPDQPPGVGD